VTLQKDQDPGWWRRGMTKRAQVIIITIAIVVLVIAGVIIAVNGIALF
jgi:flagellar basal body-associated protein FliL